MIKVPFNSESPWSMVLGGDFLEFSLLKGKLASLLMSPDE